MKLPVIRESYFLNTVILLISLFVSFITLVFGSAHLIEAAMNPELYKDDPQNLIGGIFCTGLCLVGVIFLLIAFASIKGIIYKIKKNQS